MKLEFFSRDADPKDGPYWYAVTDKGGYDGSGSDPLEALTDLAAAMEKALEERS